MPQLSEALLEAVRRQARITDLFEPGELRKAGKEFLSRCPWHDDRRPSLTVSPQRNRVHCFVCNRGADAIGWLQDRQRLSFQEAVLELARRCGIHGDMQDPEAQRRLEQEQRQRAQLLRQRSQQCERYQRALQLELKQGGPVAALLQARGIQREAVEHWRLGAAEGRLQIPLCDAAGRCVGFCGRASGDQHPRYRNSPGDLLFERQALVFGLDQAAAAIRREGTALLVEGPLDVIALHQAGFGNAVAALGTAVSPLQLQLLQRHGLKHLLLGFDGDAAGQKATERLLEQLWPQLIAGTLSAAVLQLPAGDDADGLLRRAGPEALRALIAGAQHWLEWRLAQLTAPLAAAAAASSTGSSLELLQATERQGAALLNSLPAGVLRRQAEQRLAQALGGDGPAGIPGERIALAPWRPPQALTIRQRAERRVVRLYIHAPPCRDLLGALELEDPACRAALDWLIQLDGLAADGQLAAMALPIARQVAGATGAVLAEAAAPGVEVVSVISSNPQAELGALLDALEPVQSSPAAGSAGPPEPGTSGDQICRQLGQCAAGCGAEPQQVFVDLL